MSTAPQRPPGQESRLTTACSGRRRAQIQSQPDQHAEDDWEDDRKRARAHPHLRSDRASQIARQQYRAKNARARDYTEDSTQQQDDPDGKNNTLGAFFHSLAISLILHTVRQLRSVIGTPSNFSVLAASLDLPTPSGAWR